MRSLITILVAGAIVRAVLILSMIGEPIHIVDAQHYDELASNLARTGNYSQAGELTSIRPPLYPMFLATIYRVSGDRNHDAVRIVQAILGLVNTYLVFLLAQHLFDDSRVSVVTAAIACFYPSLLFFEQLLLTETLFTTFLLLACISFSKLAITTKPTHAAVCGAMIGLAALTRSVLWLFPPFACLLLLAVLAKQDSAKRLQLAGALCLGFVIVITPWSFRNSRLHKTFTTIDVMGGRNFMMGNYEHTPMFRAWDAISIEGERSWISILMSERTDSAPLTQGQIDKLALKRGLEFVKENPALTVKRDIVKLLNFWQLERSVGAGLMRGYWGNVSKPVALGWTALIFAVYAIVLLSGILALAVTSKRPVHWFIFLMVSFICGIHTAVFGHSRYHLSLMALIIPFAAYALVYFKSVLTPQKSLQWWAAALGCMLLCFSWCFELVWVELPRLRNDSANIKTTTTVCLTACDTSTLDNLESCRESLDI